MRHEAIRNTVQCVLHFLVDLLLSMTGAGATSRKNGLCRAGTGLSVTNQIIVPRSTQAGACAGRGRRLRPAEFAIRQP